MPLVSATFDEVLTFTRASTATYVDADQVMQTAANDTPRFDYSPANGDARGILIEQASENFLNFTDDLTRGNETEVNAEVTKNAIAAPTGDELADLLEPPASGGTIEVYIERRITLSGTPLCVSCFAKADASNFIMIRIEGTPDTYAIFNVVSREVTDSGNSPVTFIEQFDNGWVRCGIALVGNQTGTIDVHFGLARETALTIDTADQNSAYIWGLQAEPQAFPTSYIPSSAVTESDPEYFFYFDQGLADPNDNIQAAHPDALVDGIFYREVITSFAPDSLPNTVTNDPSQNEVRFSQELNMNQNGNPGDVNRAEVELVPSVLAPDGTASAWRVYNTQFNAAGTNSGSNNCGKEFRAVTNNGGYSNHSSRKHVSVYVKQGKSPCCAIKFVTFTTTTFIVDFTAADPTVVIPTPGSGSGSWTVGDGSFVLDARNGTFGTPGLNPSNLDNFSITDEGDGWYRVQILAEGNTGGVLQVGPSDGQYRIITRRWESVLGQVADADDVYVWGGQVVPIGDDVTTAPYGRDQPYYPTPRLVVQPGEVTVSQAETRAADVLTATDGNWNTQDVRYSMVCRATMLPGSDTVARTFVKFYDSAAPDEDFVRLEWDSANLDLNGEFDNSALTLPSVSSPAIGDDNRVNAAFRSEDDAISFEWGLTFAGEAVITTAETSVPVCDTLELAPDNFFGHIQSFTFYPCSADDAELTQRAGA